MFGKNAHSFFVKAFVPSETKPWLARHRNLLPLGNSSYYVNNDLFRTRVFVYNYFRFLTDSDMSARWRVRCYTQKGKLAGELSGTLENRDSEIIELSQLPTLDDFGVMRVYIWPTSPDVFIPHAHASMFFNEYYSPGSARTVMAHNLHVPFASHDKVPHVRVSPGVVVSEGQRPFLLIAGGCRFHQWGHPTCGNATTTFVNDRGEERALVLPPMKPLECHWLDLFAMDSGLSAHVGTRPFIMKTEGRNFLAKPFLFISDGSLAVGEHL